MKNGRGVTGTLLSLRLRWYLIFTGRLMIRSWQWFVLALVVVPPPSLLAIVSYPFITLLAPDVSIPLRLGLLVLLSALVALWVFPQRGQILGVPFEPYFLALPVTPLQLMVVDVTTIFLATSLVLIPAFAVMLTSEALLQVHPLWSTVSLLVVVCVLLLNGYAVLRRRWHLLFVVFGANVLLAFALSAAAVTNSFALHILAFLVTLAGFLMKEKGPSRSISKAWRHADGRTVKPLQTSAWIGVALPWKILDENRRAVGLRLVAVAIASAFAAGIPSAFDYDSRSANFGISIVAFTAVMLSGVCRFFQQARGASEGYLAALPVRHIDWLLSEFACLSFLAAPFTATVVGSLVYNGVLTVSDATLVTTAQLVLLAALHQVVMHTTRQAVVVSLLLGVGWTWAVMVAV